VFAYTVVMQKNENDATLSETKCSERLETFPRAAVGTDKTDVKITKIPEPVLTIIIERFAKVSKRREFVSFRCSSYSSMDVLL